MRENKLRLTVKDRAGKYLQHCDFENAEMANNWKQVLAETAAWGRPERWVREGDEDVSQAIQTREVESMNEVITEYLLPSEYEIVEEDISAEIEEKKQKEKKRKDDKDFLKSVDWSKIKDADVRKILKAIVDRIED